MPRQLGYIFGHEFYSRDLTACMQFRGYELITAAGDLPKSIIAQIFIWLFSEEHQRIF